MGAVALDAGTTLVKAVAYDDDGEVRAVVRRPTTVRRPGGGACEQDMGEVWDCAQQALGAAVEALEGTLDLVSVTAQGDGCWLVDDDGAPVGPAALWNDARAASLLERWQQEGRVAEARRVNGCVPSTGMAHVLLAWLAREEPDRLRAASASLTCGGWLHRCLTGRTAADESAVSVSFVDPRTGALSDDLVDLHGLGGHRHLVPDLVGGADRAAPLREELASRWGVPAGTPVVLAPYDLSATSIGLGATGDDLAACVLGTTLCAASTTPRAEPVADAPGILIALGVDELLLRALPTAIGTEVVHWACGVLGLDDPQDLTALADQAEAGAGGVRFLPYLAVGGERAPFSDGAARGSFHGLDTRVGRPELARAVLEGLSACVADCVAALPRPPSELRVCGGGAASDTWVQMIADAVGVPVRRYRDAEIGARGALVVGARVVSHEGAWGRPAASEDEPVEPGPDAGAAASLAELVALRAHEAERWHEEAQR